MRRGEHLRAQPHEKPLQAMRRVEHLRAQPPKERVQAMRRGEHLRAQPQKKQVQAMRQVEHLQAQPPKKACASKAAGRASASTTAKKEGVRLSFVPDISGTEWVHSMRRPTGSRRVENLQAHTSKEVHGKKTNRETRLE
jgi:hypothetical protein